MNDLKIFENEAFGAVRVVERDGEPWFVARDVCECLELGNPRTSIALLDEDEKGVHTMDTPVQYGKDYDNGVIAILAKQ